MKFFDEEIKTIDVFTCVCDDQSCVSSGCDPFTCDD